MHKMAENLQNDFRTHCKQTAQLLQTFFLRDLGASFWEPGVSECNKMHKCKAQCVLYCYIFLQILLGPLKKQNAIVLRVLLVAFFLSSGVPGPLCSSFAGPRALESLFLPCLKSMQQKKVGPDTTQFLDATCRSKWFFIATITSGFRGAGLLLSFQAKEMGK